MADKFKLAIVGAGPGGLAAAARAAELGVSHVLLEASPHLAQTVVRYQKGKRVMAEPASLPLRSSLGFAAGTREEVLGAWQRDLAARAANVRTQAGVTAICGQRGDFALTLASGECVAAEFVVVAIGLQGNIRKLTIPGAELPGVQYQLDDPDEYAGETIMVIGGGDSGVENALALARQNRVVLVNRQEEFSQCADANLDLLNKAVEAGRIATRVTATPVCIEPGSDAGPALSVILKTPQGAERIDCDRVVARIGAEPPREMLERFGIRFPDGDAMALPQLSEQYESSVAGLYVIGAVAGYPLIKQALNQGYEVVEYILGNPVEPADQPLLWRKFSLIPGLASVDEGIDLIKGTQPIFASLTRLQLREFMLDSNVLAPQAGEVIFRRNDYGNSFFSVLRGSVLVYVLGKDGAAVELRLAGGDFFGEMGLLSGRRRSATVVAGEDCIVVETPRRSMLKLLYCAPAVQRRLDEVALKRVVRNCFGSALDEDQVDYLVQQAKSRQYAAGEVLFNEGDAADALYMIRRGSVTISRRIGGKEVVLAYVSAGNYVGEMALVSRMPRTATVRAASPTEAVLLEAKRFETVLERNASVRREVTARYLDRIRANESSATARNSDVVEFLVNQGVGEATDVLLIDYSRCIRCDNCEAACADVHDGNSRLSRDAGQTYEFIHVPASCRHCEHPRCMKDCPPDAIHRSVSGEIFINDSCMGCGNCQRNCPYGVIKIADKTDYRRPSIWELLSGRRRAAPAGAAPVRKAVKCDMCRGMIGGSACVRACPTGAAFRVSPEQFLSYIRTR